LRISKCYSAGASSSQGPIPQGRLKAKVVAADSIRASDTLKEVVVYKIRAADANGEWTVSRRYSNFEQLHRQLRDVRHMMCVVVSSTQPLGAGAFNSLACQACECEASVHTHSSANRLDTSLWCCRGLNSCTLCKKHLYEVCLIFTC